MYCNISSLANVPVPVPVQDPPASAGVGMGTGMGTGTGTGTGMGRPRPRPRMATHVDPSKTTDELLMVNVFLKKDFLDPLL